MKSFELRHSDRANSAKNRQTEQKRQWQMFSSVMWVYEPHRSQAMRFKLFSASLGPKLFNHINELHF